MVKKNLKKCVTSGAKKRVDRAPADRTSFDPVSLEVNYPDTAILLLKTPAERPILLAAAAALARYGEKARENLDVLFDLHVVDNVLALIDHEDVYTKRFALKLLALMSAVRNVQTHLLQTDTHIVSFIDMLTEDKQDVFLQEYSSRILAELSGDFTGSAMFLAKHRDVSFLFEKLKSEDPDVKKNCLETIVNLLRDFDGHSAVTTSKDFSFDAIYDLFDQPYPVIQNLALDAVELLAARNKDDGLQEAFRRSGGLGYLLDIVTHDDWRDLHEGVLRVLNVACDNPKTVEFMNNTDGTRRLFTFMETAENEKFKLEILRILVRLAETPSGRKVLQSRGIIEFLLGYFEDAPSPNAQAVVCRGLAKMTQHAPASDDIASRNPTARILDLVNNEQASWDDRRAGAFALKEIFSSDYQNCVNFLDLNGQVHLMRLIDRFEEVPWELEVTIVQSLSAIADYSSIASDLIHIDLFTALCSPFEPERMATDELKIACCNALARFPLNDEARKVLVLANVPAKLFHLIQDTETVPVRNAATQLALLLSADLQLAKLCGHEGYLIYMLKHQSVGKFVTTWDACIRALLNADLAMKFAYTGRLGMNDITDDGFYVLRKSSCPFPMLEEIFRLKLCPLQPIYVVNFNETPIAGHDLVLASKQATFEKAREDMRRESLRKGVRVSEATINAWLELKFGRVRPDSDLRAYLELFKTELEIFESKEACKCGVKVPGLTDTSKIASRASFLGKFVARQLSGVNPATTGSICVDQQLELHLKSLQDSVETSVIPLGLLRVGSYLERALLFKVLADQVALPTSLVRGKFGKSWVEIAVPTVPDKCARCDAGSDSLEDDRSTKLSWCVCNDNLELFPCTYLRENYIVDLMHEPGNLVLIGTERANQYCAEQSCYEYACCG